MRNSIITLFIFISLAWAGPDYIDFPQFQNLPTAQQKQILEKLQEIAVAWEAQTAEFNLYSSTNSEILKKQMQERFVFLANQILSQAYAQEETKESEQRWNNYLVKAKNAKPQERICMYGGWISLMVDIGGGKMRCIHPRDIKNWKKNSLGNEISQTYEAQANYYQEHADDDKACDPKKQVTMVCHPAIFGNIAVCVEAGNEHFSRNTSLACWQKYQKLDENKKDELDERLNDILDDPKKASYLAEMLKISYEMCICGDKGSHTGVDPQYSKWMYYHRTCFGLLNQSKTILGKIGDSENSCISLHGINDEEAFPFSQFAQQINDGINKNIQARIDSGVEALSKNGKKASKQDVQSDYTKAGYEYALETEKNYKAWIKNGKVDRAPANGQNDICLNGLKIDTPSEHECVIKVKLNKDPKTEMVSAEVESVSIGDDALNFEKAKFTWDPSAEEKSSVTFAKDKKVTKVSVSSIIDGKECSGKAELAKEDKGCSFTIAFSPDESNKEKGTAIISDIKIDGVVTPVIKKEMIQWSLTGEVSADGKENKNIEVKEGATLSATLTYDEAHYCTEKFVNPKQEVQPEKEEKGTCKIEIESSSSKTQFDLKAKVLIGEDEIDDANLTWYKVGAASAEAKKAYNKDEDIHSKDDGEVDLTQGEEEEKEIDSKAIKPDRMEKDYKLYAVFKNETHECRSETITISAEPKPSDGRMLQLQQPIAAPQMMPGGTLRGTTN